MAGFLGRCASPLVGLTLDDLGGEDVPVNLPGVSPARYPGWRRRMQRTLAELARDPAARAAVAAVARGRRARRGRRSAPGPV
jgi:4-alpha-glucanotransferase